MASSDASPLKKERELNKCLNNFFCISGNIWSHFCAAHVRHLDALSSAKSEREVKGNRDEQKLLYIYNWIPPGASETREDRIEGKEGEKEIIYEVGNSLSHAVVYGLRTDARTHLVFLAACP